MKPTKRIKKALTIARLANELGDYDSNVIGMVAEVIAQDRFGMDKCKKGLRAIDGHVQCKEGKRTIQVKAFSSRRIAKYKGGAMFRIPATGGPHQLLVVLVFDREEDYDTILVTSPRLFGTIEKTTPPRRLDLTP